MPAETHVDYKKLEAAVKALSLTLAEEQAAERVGPRMVIMMRALCTSFLERCQGDVKDEDQAVSRLLSLIVEFSNELLLSISSDASKKLAFQKTAASRLEKLFSALNALSEDEQIFVRSHPIQISSVITTLMSAIHLAGEKRPLASPKSTFDALCKQMSLMPESHDFQSNILASVLGTLAIIRADNARFPLLMDRSLSRYVSEKFPETVGLLAAALNSLAKNKGALCFSMLFSNQRLLRAALKSSKGTEIFEKYLQASEDNIRKLAQCQGQSAYLTLAEWLQNSFSHHKPALPLSREALALLISAYNLSPQLQRNQDFSITLRTILSHSSMPKVGSAAAIIANLNANIAALNAPDGFEMRFLMSPLEKVGRSNSNSDCEGFGRRPTVPTPPGVDSAEEKKSSVDFSQYEDGEVAAGGKSSPPMPRRAAAVGKPAVQEPQRQRVRSVSDGRPDLSRISAEAAAAQPKPSSSAGSSVSFHRGKSSVRSVGSSTTAGLMKFMSNKPPAKSGHRRRNSTFNGVNTGSGTGPKKR